MKKKTLTLLFLFSFLVLSAQESVNANHTADSHATATIDGAAPAKAAINAGVLMGGGGLVGADFELLLSPRVGLQLGAGLTSFGFGINYHLKDRINSSFISLQYLHQGLGDNHYASYIGPMFVFRTKKIFQAGIGLGYILSKGKINELETVPDIMLLYNIGVYFPL